jgi:DNA repair protein RadA/Sms
MILAVLARNGLPLHDRDVFVSVAGGLRVDEPAADLAVVMAVVSSARDRPLDPDLLVFGEVGLVGEVRGVGLPHLRLREAERHGLRSAWLPLSGVDETSRLRCRGVRRVADLLE